MSTPSTPDPLSRSLSTTPGTTVRMPWRARGRCVLMTTCSATWPVSTLTVTPSCGQVRALCWCPVSGHVSAGKCLCHSETFSSGISNGAEWYLVDNGMQDYNYLFSNCMEVTAELFCSKQPETCKLQTEWDNNFDSMLNFLGSVHGGIKGRVFDERGDRKSTRLNSSHSQQSRMPSSA